MSEILTVQELAAFLRVDDTIAARLVAETALPRVTIGGEPRFVASRVSAWLGSLEGEVLPAVVEPVVEEEEAIDVTLPSAGPGETPFVSEDALEALASGATDPARNLERLKLRDALLGLNDALAPALGRYSGGRLHSHHEEKERTSPWRLDDHPERRIVSMSLTWAAGEAGPPGYIDRPRVEVELAKGELRLMLHTLGHLSRALTESELDELSDSGAAVEMAAPGVPLEIARVYPIGTPAPTLRTIADRLEADLAVFLPIWALAVG